MIIIVKKFNKKTTNKLYNKKYKKCKVNMNTMTSETLLQGNYY